MLRDLAAAAGMSAAKAHRYLVSFQRLGLVQQLSSATGRCFVAYAPGPAIAPLLQEELALARRESRTDLPLTAQAVDDMLADVRARGMARAVDSMLPAMAGFCAPVFDCDGHLVLGLVALGSIAHFDADWNGRVAQVLHDAAARLSADLGHSG